MNPIQAPPINTPFLAGDKVSNIWMMWLRSLVEYVNDTNTVAFNTNSQMIPVPSETSSSIPTAGVDVSGVLSMLTIPNTSTADVGVDQIYPMLHTTTTSQNDDCLTLHWMEA